MLGPPPLLAPICCTVVFWHLSIDAESSPPLVPIYSMDQLDVHKKGKVAFHQLVISTLESNLISHKRTVTNFGIRRYFCCSRFWFIYRPPTRLQKGNIFSNVCQSSPLQGDPCTTLALPISLCRAPAPDPSRNAQICSTCSTLLTVKHGLPNSGRLVFHWNTFLLWYKGAL